MSVATPTPASGAEGRLDVYVAADGKVLSTDAAFLMRGADDGAELVPCPLVDLALGLLAEGANNASFVWRGDKAAPYWVVHIERTAVGTRLAARLSAERTEHLPYSLSDRELDVLGLMIAGLSNAAISTALNVSQRTVTTHVDHIMRKMGAPNRAAAATAALDAGVIGVPLPADSSEFLTLRIGRIVQSAGSRPRTAASQRAGAELRTPILVGSIVPAEGRAHEDGIEMIRGTSLAIDEINARGGIHGRPLQLVVEYIDIDRTGLSKVTQAMHRLLRNGVHSVTSGYLLHQGRAVELAAEEGIPFLHASASSYIDSIVSADPARHASIFQVCPNDRNYAPSFINLMTNLRDSGQWAPGSRELAIAQQSAWETIDFGLDQAIELGSEQGWDVIPLTVMDREGDGQAWGELATQIGAPAAVMLGSFFPEDHLRFLDSFHAAPSSSLLYSIYAPSVPSFRRHLRTRTDGLLWATTAGTYSDDIARHFVQAYTSKFAAAPGRSMAGTSYDRINILAQAWSQTGDPRAFDEVASSLLSTRFRGVNGAYMFDRSGHGTLPLGTSSSDPSITQAHTIFQLQRNKNVLIDPAVYATGQFILPSWLQRN